MDVVVDLDKECDVVVIDHLPDVERMELPSVPRAGAIYAQVETALAETLGVAPMELQPGKKPTIVFKRCIVGGGRQRCKGCRRTHYEDPCGRKNVEHPFPRFGFSIGLSKFDDAFNEKLPDNRFRYKHDEVLEILKAMINDIDELSPEIWWDRGGGAFVYNLFFKESES